jgi:hypothetical protein
MLGQIHPSKILDKHLLSTGGDLSTSFVHHSARSAEHILKKAKGHMQGGGPDDYGAPGMLETYLYRHPMGSSGSMTMELQEVASNRAFVNS